MATEFLSKCDILKEVWLNHRNNADYKEFVEYNDLALPLAFVISEGIVAASSRAKTYIEEAFQLLLLTLEIQDKGFDSFEQMLNQSS